MWCKVGETLDCCCGNPVSQLHFLSLLAYHDKKYKAEHRTRKYQHLPIRQPAMREKRQYGNNPRKERTDKRSDENGSISHAQMVALQEQHYFEPFSVKRGESKEAKSPKQAGFRDLRTLSIVQERLLSSIMETDPAAPINFMEEPIHYHHQNYDGQKASPSLKIQSRNVLGEILDNAHLDEPGHQSGENSDTHTNGNRFPLVGVGTDHASHDCREYQNTFQAFAENQHPDIE